ncbi:MAG: glucose-6-phosphate dehydrogenase assembly protein OpcA [Akkermansiaceae bacterium]|jgi:glucose-6-phosphate dehydrogenase assembly protein OpcA
MSEPISTEGLGCKVPVSAIPLELKKLWEADEASTNASLMNFLVYTEDPRRLAENSKTIQNLTREHACRAVLIAMDRKAPESSVDAWITAHCHLAHGKKSICSEQISFLLHGKSMGRLRNTVFANLNSDLPLVFWWQDELSDLFEDRLYRLLNRLIFDSSTWSQPKEGFERIVEARSDTKGRLVIQDLAWTRSFHYRLAIAGLFDDPIAQNSLPNIESVSITAQSGQRTSALLLLAWVASQAGWTLASAEGSIFEFTSKSGQAIQADLNWDDEGAPISELCFKAPNCEVKVLRKVGSVHLCHVLCTDGHCLDFSGPADADGAAGLVANQLSRGGKNSLFLRVLPTFFELL